MWRVTLAILRSSTPAAAAAVRTRGAASAQTASRVDAGAESLGAWTISATDWSDRRWSVSVSPPRICRNTAPRLGAGSQPGLDRADCASVSHARVRELAGHADIRTTTHLHRRQPPHASSRRSPSAGVGARVHDEQPRATDRPLRRPTSRTQQPPRLSTSARRLVRGVFCTKTQTPPSSRRGRLSTAATERTAPWPARVGTCGYRR